MRANLAPHVRANARKHLDTDQLLTCWQPLHLAAAALALPRIYTQTQLPLGRLARSFVGWNWRRRRWRAGVIDMRPARNLFASGLIRRPELKNPQNAKRTGANIHLRTCCSRCQLPIALNLH